MKRSASFLITAQLVLGFPAHAVVYRLERNDAISLIIQRYVEGRIYGRDGILACVEKMNPAIRGQKTLPIGTTIHLPIDKIEEIPPEKRSRKTSHWANWRSPSECDPRSTGGETIRDSAIALSLRESVPVETPRAPAAAIAVEAGPASAVAVSAEPGRGPESSVPQSDDSLAVPSAFRLGAFGSFSRISAEQKSNGTHSMLVSTFSPGVTGTWAQRWSPEIESSLALSVQKRSIAPSSTVTFSGLDQYCTSIRAAVAYSKGAVWSGTAGIAYTEQLFYRATAPTALVIEKMSVPELSAGGAARLVRRGPLSLTATAEAALLFPATSDAYAAQTGAAARTGLQIEHTRPNWPIRGGIRFDWARQNTSQLEMTRHDLMLWLGTQVEFK